MRSIGQYKVCQPMCDRGSRRWRKRKGDQKYIWGNYGWKLTKPKEGIDIQVLEACVDMLSHFICVWFFETLWTVGRQAPLSMGFSRHGYWSEFPGPSPGDLPDPGMEPTSLMSPALAGGFFTTSSIWEAHQGSPSRVTKEEIFAHQGIPWAAWITHW